MDISKVGWHTSIRDLLTLSPEFVERHNTYQVFVGSPRTMKMPSFTDLAILKKRYPNLDIVVHMPYVLTLSKPVGDEHYIKSLSYVIGCARSLDKLGIKYIVVHLGARTETMTVQDSMVSIWNFCTKFLLSTEGCNIKLCLENDVGSKKGTKMGHLKVLDLVIRKMNSPRIRMCFDTEHAYAAGFDINSKSELEKLSDLVDVIHWNAVPMNVEFGQHLDRHSTTSFYDSKVSPFQVYDVLYNGVRPFIFEVDSGVFVKSNLEYIKEVGNNGR